MYGEGPGPRPKRSPRGRASTIGATGRNCSRPLTSLSRSRLRWWPGCASSERWPSARGPYSLRPWNQATISSAARDSAATIAASAGRSYGTRARTSSASISSSLHPRPRSAPTNSAGGTPSACGDRQRGAQRRTGVPGRRLHPDPLVRTLGEQPRVGHAVERHSAGKRQRLAANLRVQPAGEVEQHLLQPALHAAREVGVVAGPLVPAPQGLGEARPVHWFGAEAAVARGVHVLAQVVEEARLAVRGKRHDLVLVAAAQEAQMLGDILVQQTKGVRQPLRRNGFEPAVTVSPGQVTGALAAPVEHEHRRRAVAGGQTRGSGVRLVMTDEAHDAGVEPGQRAGEE